MLRGREAAAIDARMREEGLSGEERRKEPSRNGRHGSWARLAAGLLSLALLGAATAPRAPAAGPQSVEVRSARLEEGRAGFALRLELDRMAPFRAYMLADPPRAVLEFPRLEWRAPLPAPRAAGGLARALSAAPAGAGGARLTVALSRPARIVSAGYPEGGGGFELLLRALPGAAPAQPADAPPPAPRPAPPPLVVIDPGHGGADPGAVRGDVLEKDLALAFARELRDALRRDGRVRVAMTRDEDVFLGLRERVRIAAAAGAAAFVSIHVNTVESGDASGASVHTLSESASDEEAAALAAFENRADLPGGDELEGEGDDVARALIDLARRRAQARSRELAEALLRGLGRAAPILPGRAHRFAGFRVLKSPSMASALVELGFMSNPDDLRNLSDPAWRRRAARAMAAALGDWAERRARAPAFAPPPAEARAAAPGYRQ
ncbi:N-acetylmuramoyl-L-alanine amidase [Oceanicella actignis]|nr:N-acetylmuramoyl-L-alanine amidase [Oceanicella actignis]